jgi:hypothetical protein
MRKYLPFLIILTATALACNAGGFFEAVTATPMPLPTLAATNLDPNYQPGGATAIPPTFAPTATSFSQPFPALSSESLLILSPGPQSQVTSPITVSGISNPTFENTLYMQVLDENGEEIGNGQAIIHADLGQRGPFEGTVEFIAPAAQQVGTLLISDSSARDGHLVHVSSMPIILLPAGGAADILGAGERPEDIAIDSPAFQQVLSGGVAHISGLSVPYFEQTVSIAILDADGATVGSGTASIQGDVGQAGRFEADVPYSVSSEQPGAIQVYATSARDGSLTHLSSVEVTLQP